jgi:hypothetical protein
VLALACARRRGEWEARADHDEIDDHSPEHAKTFMLHVDDPGERRDQEWGR